MGKTKAVSILGVRYEIGYGEVPEGADGVCDINSKRITVMPDSKRDGTKEERRFSRDITVRHEIAHAFLDESGLSEYSADETLVCWLAYQMPRMVEAMRAAGAL